MELNVTKSSNLKGKNVTLKKKCRHNNYGYCKMKTECVYRHSDQICDQFLANGKCTEARLCLDRHPKECKFWLGDPQGCLRGELCKYLHTNESKGKDVKNGDIHNRAEETNVIFPDKSTPNVEKEIDNTSDDINDGEQLNEEDMVVDMEEEPSNKDEIIVKLGTKSLEGENKVLKEQL